MFNDLDVECWEGIHMDIIKKISIPSMIWVIGVPIALFYQLRIAKPTVLRMSRTDIKFTKNEKF